ncbi:MAG: tyrosine-type recombinase/integrase [Candidatus Methanosuratincola petrocarbonis]
MTKKGAFFKQTRNCTVQPKTECTVQLGEFEKFCRVDLRLKPESVRRHLVCVRQILAFCGPSPTAKTIREFLSAVENPFTYNNYLKSLRVYFRDFLGRPEVVATFRFSKTEAVPPRLFSKKELRDFYSALDTEAERALFLLYATSGRRRSEVLGLKMDQMDLSQRVLVPTKLGGTKRTWYSFFNGEAEAALREYLEVRQDPKRNGMLFPLSSANRGTIFRLAQHRTGLKITPQALRFWFANEMARLGVPDRFIDAFQGRVPRSVLARHYTDYSPENLKAIYDRAGLKVLS